MHKAILQDAPGPETGRGGWFSRWLSPPAGGFGDIGLTATWFAATMFLCGAVSSRVVNLVGEIYLAELLIIQIALWLLVLGRKRALLGLPAFGLFLQTAVIMLAGYMLSDLYRDTNPAQFLRGWARVILLILDFVALAVIVANDRRSLWWFVLGMGIGTVVGLLVKGTPVMSPAGWKFGYSVPIMYIVACLGYFLPVKLASAAFLLLGLWNIFMDFRILGMICMLIAAILWARSEGGLSRQQGLRMAAAGMVAVAVAAGALIATQGDYGQRREQSNLGREAGLVVAAWAIAESPLIGFGSWPTDHRLVNLYRQELQDEGRLHGEAARVGVFAAHSQILQAWVEGGLLAVLFWFFYGCRLATAGHYTILRRATDGYTPVFLIFLIYDFWHLLMSPFSGPTRLPIAVGIAVICMCAKELADGRSRGIVHRPVAG